jgi:RNA polymerase sigma-70 factor (ECF subfamily)
MTSWSESMRFIESLGRSISEAPPVQSSDTKLDEDARRLAAGVARGDEKAFQELYDRYQERLFRFGLVLGHGNETMAGEMVQSVFVIAAAKLRAVDGEQHLWNWLALVGRQQVFKMRRRQHKDSALLTGATLPDCSDPDELDKRLESALDAALTELAHEDQRVIEWFYFDGLSHQQIADRTGTTSKAVSSRLERVRAWLRRRVQRTLSCEL